MEPPPIPDQPRLRYATFRETLSGTFGSNRDACMIEAAQKSATDWVNAYAGIEIVSINTCITDRLAAVTIWYRA